MHEQLPENQHELNQLAKKLLKDVKQRPEPNMLYCLQLAKWGLESGKVESLRDGLRENLESLLFEWSPEKAQKFILQGDEESEEDLLAGLEKKYLNDPLYLSVALLEHLDSRLSATLPGYPRARDLPAGFR
jgi:hypothetical protein